MSTGEERQAARVSFEYPEHQGEHDDPLPDTIWYRVDRSNSYWIYVDHPSLHLGGVPVGVQRAYQKELSAQDARAMAQALVQAADELDTLQAEQEAERLRMAELVRRCEQEHGGHDYPRGFLTASWKCRRCGTAVVHETSATGNVIFEQMPFAAGPVNT